MQVQIQQARTNRTGAFNMATSDLKTGGDLQQTYTNAGTTLECIRGTIKALLCIYTMQKATKSHSKIIQP